VFLFVAAAAPAHALCVLCVGSVTATPLAFGAYDPLNTNPTDSTSTVTVSITGAVGLLVGYDISLSAGHSNNVANRWMLNGTTPMQYNLYLDSNRGTVWGSAVGATVADSFTLNLLGTASRGHTVFGRIPALQTTVQPGPYNDTISVSVLF
jgi:spore coat protein U-like protein